MPNADLPLAELIIRPATEGDSAAALACVVEAFEPYIERIGKAPAPMLLNYPALIAEGCVWVAQVNNQLEGVLVQYETQDGSSIRWPSAPNAEERALVGHSLVFPRTRLFDAGSRPSICARTPK